MDSPFRRGAVGNFLRQCIFLFSWQAQYLVNLGDVVKGSKASFCEAVVVFDLVRQVVVLGAVLRMRFELSLSRCARSAW